MWNFFDIAVLAAGYVASIYTWPWIRTKAVGAEAEIVALQAKAAALKAAL